MLRIRTLGAMGTSLIALVAGTGLAAAADFPNYEPPPAAVYNPAPAFTWTGPYVGLQGGYGWGGGTIGTSGWIGGAYAGYNFQTGTNLVLGIEGDISATGKSGSSGGQTITNPWDGTIRARVGYAVDRFMIYGTGGAAFGKISSNDGSAPVESVSKVGWTAGVGVEAAVTDNVTARVEFRHTNLGTATFATDPAVTYTSNDVLVGIGFKF